MKELSIEEKAKAYDEVLNKLRRFMAQGVDPLITRADVQDFFPELAESEDERIREEIIDKIADHSSLTHYDPSKYFAWLEKQGEHKSADKVEPKFKVGDWIIDKQGIVHQIANVIENVTYYTYGYDIVGGGYFNDKTEGVRFWTIQDAKDGDVLAGSKDGVILMFRGIGNTEWDNVIDYHCYYDCYREDFIVQEDIEYWGYTEEGNQLKPATKEQRDLLFQKMKETGYEWDAEKKELKKIEQNPAWSEEDERMFKSALWHIKNSCGNQGKNSGEFEVYNWLKSKFKIESRDRNINNF